jgi:hypothetical protein
MVKFIPVLLQEPRRKDAWGSGCILHPFLTSEVDGCEW